MAEKTIRDTLKGNKFPFAELSRIIVEKSRGTIAQDDAARLAIRLIDKPSDAAIRVIASEIMARRPKSKLENA